MGNERGSDWPASSWGGQSGETFEKTLRSHQLLLSRSLSSCLVNVICSHLSSNRMVTDFEDQVIRSQPTELQMSLQLLQVLLRKGSKACQQFFQALECFDPILFQKVTGAPARGMPVETPPCKLQDAPQTHVQGAAPTYIVNIHNSTLTSCIIGSNNGQCVSRDLQCVLSQSSDPAAPEEERVCSMCGQKGAAQTASAPASLQVHSSNLEYVIIGDNNSLTVKEQQLPEELEE